MNYMIKQLPICFLLVYYMFTLYNDLLLHLNISNSIYVVVLIAALFPLQKYCSLLTNSEGISQADFYLFILIFVSGFSVVAQNAFYSSYIGFDGINTRAQLKNIWGVSVLWLLVGCACAGFRIEKSEIVCGLLVILLAYCIFTALDGGIVINYYKYKVEAGDFSISHLGMENSLVVLLFFSYSVTNKFRIPVAAVGIMCMFATGGRAALFFFIIAVVLYEYKFRNNATVLLTSIGLAALAAILYALILFDVILLTDPSVRTILFLDGISGDSSYDARGLIFIENMKLLPAQIFFGDVSAIAEMFGEQGYYIHNLLSAWQFYGLATFLLMVWLLLMSCKETFLYMGANNSPIVEFGILILIYTVSSVIFAKSVGFNLLWFTLGFWIYRRQITNTT